MKILNKTLDILEYVINSPGHPLTPSEIAEGLGISAVSCVRVLADLTERGYLERISRNTGYVPGPAVFTFKDRMQWNYARLVEAAREPITELARSLGTIANISVMHKTSKYILFHCNSSGDRVLKLQTRYDNEHYYTATGRLLLHTCTPEELEQIYQEESANIIVEWEGVTDLSSFLEAVQEVARQGNVCYVDHGGTCIVGTLIRLPHLLAAIGFGCTPEQSEEACRLAAKAARDIANNYTMKGVLK